MTSKQIRAAKFESDSAEWECARWLQEIAAHLADLNQHGEFVCCEMAHARQVSEEKRKRKARERRRR